MAEFEYIMRQANRMCNAQTICNKECSVYVYGRCCVSMEGHGIGGPIDYADMEARVIDWVKNHPEPVYPSWEEGWRQLFPKAITAICPLMCATGSAMDEYRRKCAGRSCDECKKTQIDAEVAKKLGIKPIGGE